MSESVEEGLKGHHIPVEGLTEEENVQFFRIDESGNACVSHESFELAGLQCVHVHSIPKAGVEAENLL